MSELINDFVEFQIGKFTFLKRLRDIKSIHQNQKYDDSPFRLHIYEYDGQHFYADNKIDDIQTQIRQIEGMKK